MHSEQGAPAKSANVALAAAALLRDIDPRKRHALFQKLMLSNRLTQVQLRDAAWWRRRSHLVQVMRLARSVVSTRQGMKHWSALIQ
ncbi:MAG: hypothetical protein HC871_00305 [Rhizobiales bacterium]|nr:hypothetical protein [Hyphomicrobiales bacterium]